MDERFQGLGFYPADILLPRDCDLTKWAVVACDQYTSQPEYWQRVEFFVGNSPSALHLILPESSLEGPSVETDILDINNTMSRYLREGRFRTLEHAMIYVERTLESGRVRRGVVGMVDLEQYDYEPGADTLIRATEGTVLSRIPPRVAVRKNAPIELPHAMVLADDPGRTVIEPLTALRDRLEPVYDFELMEHSGHLRGWLLGEAEQGAVAAALRALSDPAAFHARYGTKDKPVMLYAMGDGNHSFAAAKAHWDTLKTSLTADEREWHPARFGLVELVNLYDSALAFEPIHRLLMGVDPKAVQHDLDFDAENPPELQKLQPMLDEWLSQHPEAQLEYIHGEADCRRLGQASDRLAIAWKKFDKEKLFPDVARHGVLCRKSFSMGSAPDKRFYLECRKIR